jgi:hypothetical protein
MFGMHKDVEHNNVNGKLGNKHLHFQKKIERHGRTSLHCDCTAVTPPRQFNPVSRYDCSTPHTQELTTEAPDEMCDVACEKKWRGRGGGGHSNVRSMETKQSWMKDGMRMTPIPS